MIAPGNPQTNPGFKQLADLRHLGGNEFMLLNDLYFYSEKYERIFMVPRETITDLASIPWWAQSFCQVLGNNIRSAILHDYNCRDEGKKLNRVSQKTADDLFHEGMSLDHVRWSKARVMYRMVTIYQRAKFFAKPGVSYAKLIDS